MFKFKDGSFIRPISSKSVRSVRGNFLTCECFDLESDNNETVIARVDVRKPIKRFVPVHWFPKYSL